MEKGESRNFLFELTAPSKGPREAPTSKFKHFETLYTHVVEKPSQIINFGFLLELALTKGRFKS